ncbi:MAG: GH39 family glycosyl hydrolase, partial [Limnochordia bacterium]
MHKKNLPLQIVVVWAVVAAALFVLTGLAAAQIVVDAARVGEPINRGLFSIVNYQKLFQDGNELAQLQFAQLNPKGTQARIETRLSEALSEPPPGEDIHWERDFHPEKNIVYVEDAQAFMEHVLEMGMEPVLLLGYSAPWFSTNGRPTGPPRRLNDWVEYALRTIESFGFDEQGRSRIKYVEVWNEPNIEQFWTGTQQEYFSLFNATAKAIHQRFPGVMVGGPALSPQGNMEQWLVDFIAACGQEADFISYHSYGQAVSHVVSDIQKYAAAFREATGKQGPRIMITESDITSRVSHKLPYLFERQFALLELSHELLGFHQFSLPYYQEGEWEFGMIDMDGTVVGRNYWPYWAFRDYYGFDAGLEIPPELAALGVKGAASIDSPQGETVSMVLFNYGSQDADDMVVEINLPPSDDLRVATISRITLAGGFIEYVEPVPPGETGYKTTLDLPGRTGLTVTIRPTVDQPDVWANLTVSHHELILGDTFTAKLVVHNTGSTALDGSAFLVGGPTDWIITPPTIRFTGLEPGQRLEETVQVQTTSATPASGAALYTFVNYRKPGTRTIRAASVPQKLHVRAPLVFDIFPPQVYAAPGRTAEFKVRATNTFNADINGELLLALPEDWPVVPPQEYQLSLGASHDFVLELPVPVEAAEDDYQAEVIFTYNDAPFGEMLDIYVREFSQREAEIISLAEFFNADLFTHDGDYGDVYNFGGHFSYPARFYPSDEMVSFLGVDFYFPSTASGRANGVHTEGQLVAVPQGKYGAVYMITAATNGDKAVDFWLHYADGTTETQPVKVTDWCVDARYDDLEILKAPYRHMPAGRLFDAQPRLSLVSVPVDSEREL